ncbi:hypothetical protein, partial [Pseudomonas aeruginosa]|uniref:hypothetical protein n=1 Tax=Pseudomonas aeruginosa TaxID=287 RepID=UPI001ED99CEC
GSVDHYTVSRGQAASTFSCATYMQVDGSRSMVLIMVLWARDGINALVLMGYYGRLIIEWE